MTDNEKRAHDLALVLVAEIIKPEYVAGEAPDANGQIKVDLYQKYKKVYDSILKALKADYPNGN